MSTIYDDGSYVITEQAFSTPTRIYPLAHATVRLRRDPLWLAIAATAVAWAALATYGDLLTIQEYVVLLAVPIILILIALCVGMIAVDAIGHKTTVVFTGSAKARKIFAAMRRAKLAEIRGSAAIEIATEQSGK